ncbi:MAG: hydantoinase/oxoprolinase family protein [Rhodothermales bacterium]
MTDRERLGIDVGGTFTDFVHLKNGVLFAHKVPTTPDDQSAAIGSGIRQLRAAEQAAIAHGTTTATNALLERRGARCALVTTKGFRDVLAIGRQNRPHLYDLSQHRPAPLVPDALRFEVDERIAADGSIVRPLDEDEVASVAAALRGLEVESVAVVFLFSFRHPEHERRAAEILAAHLPHVDVCVSSEVLPEYREFERTATTVVNAYVQPVIGRYVERLTDVVAPRSIRIMQSNGGTIGPVQAAVQPARLMLSGPAGGVVGAFNLCRTTLGDPAPRLLTLDMGGTSTDVALCPGRIPRTSESEIAGLPLRLPSIDIHTVGAGGGSIARVDDAGALHVGPTSAGAVPGPACYGRGGTEPTVTDANLVVGRLLFDRFLGGDVELDVDAARAAVDSRARGLGLSCTETALGIIRIANAAMERALRRVSIERGHDPKQYTLVPFGGAGPLHACELADALGIGRIVLPTHPGVLSALGLLMADVVYDASISILNRGDETAALYRRQREHVLEVMAREGFEAPAVETFVDMRYRGQSYELTVPVDLPNESPDAAAARFHEAHRRRYGHARPDAAVEPVTVRVRATAAGAEVALPREEEAAASDAAPFDRRTLVRSDGHEVAAPIYERDALRYGHTVDGPAVIAQYDATIYVAGGWRASVDPWRTLHLTTAHLNTA